MLTYGALVFFYLVTFYKKIIITPFLLLGSAFTFFAVSLGYGMILPEQYHSYAVEDCAKMAGILTWFYYFYSASFKIIKPQLLANDSGK